MWIKNLNLALSIGGIYSKDYSGWQVTAAYAPLGRLGLGRVLKIASVDG